MKVICDRGALVEALNLAGSVVVSRTPKPVLLCVKLEAADGRLMISATDMEAAIHLTVDQVDVQDEGVVLAPADKLTAIVRESVDATITLETDAEATHIQGEDSHFKIFGHSVDDFPPIERFDGDSDFDMNAGQLVGLIHKTLFATARETSRYAINGVLVEVDGKKLTMVATDGRRLALAKGSCSGAKNESNAIIPTKALNLLTKLIDDPAGSVKVRISEDQALFGTDRATLITNLVQGNFPPYEDVIPKDQDRKASFNTDVLASGVRRASLLTNEESKGVRFVFDGEQLVLTSRAPEMGEAEVTVPVESFSGDGIEIGFNPFFVTDGLKVVDGEEVTIEMKGPNKPGIVRAGSDYQYVIMPVSLA